MSGSYSTNFSNYNSDFPASATAGADGYDMTHPTPSEGSESNDLAKTFRPPPLGAFGLPEGADPFGGPADASTPNETPADAWAAFGTDGDSGNGGGPKVQLDAGLESSSEVEDSNIPTGSVDIEGGGGLFQSSA